jgi:NADH:ubiquinone oxidoreductase subunit E
MKVKICVGSNCTLLGSMGILDQVEDLKELIHEDTDNYYDEELEIEAIKCLGHCKITNDEVAPIVVVDEDVIFNATSQLVMEKIVEKVRK